jgi:hypothetical protein
LVADMPLNVTGVAQMKFAPLMATRSPTPRVAGVKLVIRGATVKLVPLVDVRRPARRRDRPAS